MSTTMKMHVWDFLGKDIWNLSILVAGILLGGLLLFVVARILIRYFQPSLSSPQWKGKSQFAQVMGMNLHYVIEGKGSPILLLHGIGAQIFSWRHLIPLLSKHFRVIALDLPGFGDSSKDPNLSYGLDEQCDRIEAFVSSLGINKVRLIGSSMGGTLALHLACRRPDRFFEVICISPATSQMVLPAKISGLKWAASGLQYLVTPTFVGQVLRSVVEKKELRETQNIRQYLAPYYRQPDAIRTFLLASRFLADPRIEKNPGQVKVPILYLWGVKDRIIPLRWLRQLQNRWGQQRIRVVLHPEGGHHLMEDDPEWVFNECLNFFRQ